MFGLLTPQAWAHPTTQESAGSAQISWVSRFFSVNVGTLGFSLTSIAFLVKQMLFDLTDFSSIYCLQFEVKKKNGRIMGRNDYGNCTRILA